MLVGVLKTDGGLHSAEKLAVVTAGQIIQIGADASGTDALEARKLENKIIDILVDHHGEVQREERAKLDEVGHEHLDVPLHSVQDADDALANIVEASKGSLFESHFAREEVQAHIRGVLYQWFNTSKHIERDWHSKGHKIVGGKVEKNEAHDSDHPSVRAWRAAYNG